MGNLINEKIDNSKLRLFTEEDWYGLAGAEPFEDKDGIHTDPSLAYPTYDKSDWDDSGMTEKDKKEMNEVVLVADAGGVEVHGLNLAYYLALPNSRELILLTAQAILDKCLPISEKKLVALGFDKINW